MLTSPPPPRLSAYTPTRIEPLAALTSLRTARSLHLLLSVALTDLLSEIERCGDNFGVDEGTEHQAVEQVLALMQDANGEVKNLAVKA